MGYVMIFLREIMLSIYLRLNMDVIIIICKVRCSDNGYSYYN